jgi:hypothetical protein
MGLFGDPFNLHPTTGHLAQKNVKSGHSSINYSQIMDLENANLNEANKTKFYNKHPNNLVRLRMFQFSSVFCISRVDTSVQKTKKLQSADY